MSQGVVSYPGIVKAKMGRYTQTHGTRPDRITIECVPQPVGQIHEIGDCVFSWPGVNFILRDCHAERSNLRATTGGHIQHITLHDRRWRWWTGGDVSGLYNIKDSDGEYVERLKKSARELAEILLDAMGEESRILDDLPADQYPERSWVCSHPATELDLLCDEFGCRVVLGFDQDPVRVVALGKGVTPPANGHLLNIDHGLDSANLPDEFAVCGDIIEYDGIFELEAVGEDLDGSIKAIDDLSYKPSEGWVNNNFRNIRVATLAEELDESQRKLAEQLAEKTVFKWYRPKWLSGVWEGSGTVPETETEIQTADQFELKNYRLSAAETDFGYFVRKQVAIYGKHARMDERGIPIGTNDGNALSTPILAAVPTNANVGDDNIVRLTRRVLLLSTDETVNVVDNIQTVAPRLFCRCAFTVRDYDSWMPIRWKHKVTARDEPVGAGTYVLQQPEVRYEVVLNYLEQSDGVEASVDATPVYAGTITTNKATCLAQSVDYIESLIPRYQLTERFDVVYRGLIPVYPTGTFHQVTIHVSDDRGAFTVIGYNSETDPYITGYRMKRRRAIADAMERSRGRRTNRLRYNRRVGRRTFE